MYNDYLQVIITLVTACNTYRSHTGKGVAVAFFVGWKGEGVEWMITFISPLLKLKLFKALKSFLCNFYMEKKINIKW